MSGRWVLSRSTGIALTSSVLASSSISVPTCPGRRPSGGAKVGDFTSRDSFVIEPQVAAGEENGVPEG